MVRRVLVVEDEPALRTLCQRLITTLGHECESADGSASAAELLGTRSFDVILCDYRLRGETAHAVVDVVARIAPAMVARIVIASGATTDPDVVALADRHGLKVISKPYGMRELSDVIDSAPAQPQG